MAFSHEEQLFADEILRITGMRLSKEKSYLIEHRMRNLSETGTSLGQIAAQLRLAKDPALVDKIVDRILTHETSFFRDTHIFDTLTKQIIPQWMKRKGMDATQGQDVRLKIWSCGCSTGQEPYSILMSIHEAFPFLTSNLQLIATDITEQTLDRARLASYTDFEIGRGVAPSLLDRYFHKTEAGYQLKPEFRDRVNFSRLNLVNDPYPGGFDIVFCRNVLIYIEDSIRKGIFEKLRASLKTDGILILGGAESVSGFLENYVLRRHGSSMYYEVNPSKVTFFKSPGGEKT